MSGFRRVGRWALLTAPVVVLAACSSVSAGHGTYGGPAPSADSRVKVFDQVQMAHDIQADPQGKLLGAVTCPPDELVAKGRTFDCHAGNRVVIHIVVTSDSGDYTWTPEQDN